VTVVVTGAAGQLGSALAAGLSTDSAVKAFTRAELDLTDTSATLSALHDAAPAVIVNAVAFNDVDGSETNATRAFSVNAIAVRTLARAAEATGATLVHFSTDFVFDGETDRPYSEDDAPSPRSVYAQSKLVGEWMAASWQRHYVLRVESLFGGPQAKSSVDRFVNGLRAGEEITPFADREVSPSFVDDVVGATRQLIQRRAPYGLYHCVNSGHTAWVNVAREIARHLAVPNPRIRPISVKDVTYRASRPRYAALDNSKLAHAGITMPSWQDALARYLAAS
jgi:dTDP-4-dehydrorhamnose reductase